MIYCCDECAVKHRYTMRNVDLEGKRPCWICCKLCETTYSRSTPEENKEAALTLIWIAGLLFGTFLVIYLYRTLL